MLSINLIATPLVVPQVRTTKQYARVLTSIELRWLPELCPAFFAAKAGVGAAGEQPF